jgi:lactobin A/cerein 7B family class IIb bacteriocin
MAVQYRPGHISGADLMDTQSHGLRTLSTEECEIISGGVGWFVAALVLGGAAGAGTLLGYCTASKEEEVLVPKIQFPD